MDEPNPPDNPGRPDFQAAANWQGKQFDVICRWLLRHNGIKVDDRPFVVPELGVEIDAEVRMGDTTLWVEFKGSYQGERPGLMRTDTVKKAITTGALLATGEYPPYVILASHLPVIGSSGDRMLEVARSVGYVADVVNVHDPIAVKEFLRRWS